MAIVLFAFVTLISFMSPFILNAVKNQKDLITEDQIFFGKSSFKKAIESIDWERFVKCCRSENSLPRSPMSDYLGIEMKASDLIPTLEEDDDYDELIEEGPFDNNGDLDGDIDPVWIAEVIARYPYDENQKKEIRQIGYNKVRGDDTPVICINGHVYSYDNNKELSDAYNKAEDAHYLSWGKQAQYNNMRELLRKAKDWTRTAEERERFADWFSRPKDAVEELQYQDMLDCARLAKEQAKECSKQARLIWNKYFK